MIDTMLHYEQTDAGLRAQNNGRKKERRHKVGYKPARWHAGYQERQGQSQSMDLQGFALIQSRIIPGTWTQREVNRSVY